LSHRPTKRRAPQTNGMVERFNGRISDILKTHRFQSGEDLRATLHRYVAFTIINCRKARWAAKPRFRP